MRNKEFGIRMEMRTKSLALNVLRVLKLLSYDPEEKLIRYQLAKSATSIGANYREANKANSKNDFRYRIKICLSEANETIYWLELIRDLNWINDQKIEPLIKESKEIIAIFTSVKTKLK